MSDPVDWRLATWEGNRLRQHRAFQALSFREKLQVVEQLGEVAAYFAARRRARGLPVSGTSQVREPPPEQEPAGGGGGGSSPY